MSRLYEALIFVAFVVMVSVGSYAWGQYVATTRCNLATTTTALQQTNAAVATNTAAQSAANAVADVSAARHTQIVTRFLPIEREVTRYVQTPAAATACLDDAGLRIWRAANLGEFDSASSPSAGHAALPGSGAAGIGPIGRSADEPRRDGEGVPGVPSAPEGTGGSHQRDTAGDQ